MKKTSKYYFLLTVLFLVVSQIASGQNKKAIDLDALRKWPSLIKGRSGMSPDGNFAFFFIENEKPGYNTLLISSTEGSWSKKIIAKEFGYSRLAFSNNSKYFAFMQGDSLGVVTLGTSETRYVAGVDNFEILKNDPLCIIYETKESPKRVVKYDLAKSASLLTINCETYTISPGGNYLICQLNTVIEDHKTSEIIWYDLTDLSYHKIWEGSPARSFRFNNTGDKLAFIVEKAEKQQNPEAGHLPNSLVVYIKGNKSAEIVCSSDTIGGDPHSYFSSIDNFNLEANRIFVTITTPLPKAQTFTPIAKVDIYNFNDAAPQWKQLGKRNAFEATGGFVQDDITTLFGVNLDDYSTYKLRESWESSTNNFSRSYFNDQFMVVVGNGMSGVPGNGCWNKRASSTISLINTLNGKRTEIGSGAKWYEIIFNMYQISPGGKYVLYYDFNSRNYFSYEISTGKRRNLTKEIRTLWNYTQNGFLASDFKFLRGIAAWINGSNDVLVYDQFDIWRFKLDGTKPPICITNGYGKVNNTKFYLFNNALSGEVVEDGSVLYASGFNEKNKKNGFFAILSNKQQNPGLLTMDDCVYYVSPNDIVHNWGTNVPIKASNADKWIVCKQSALESCNYFFTDDFKKFKSLTEIHPEKSYNWLTTELINWRLPDGRISQGVLYKPENFDAKKKYPIIFNYYEYLSNNLNVFIQPGLSAGEINIPYYVSNGYLVFTPDIKGSKNGAGQDALNTVVSAAEYLSKFPFVDVKKMGLEGGSMGGYKTQFIITHSNLFAAANANCGVSNLSSMALFSMLNDDNQETFQYGQFYLGYSIIERPDLYIKNSPIFYIKNIQTPLLVMHNPKDYNVPDVQSLDLFNAMRRAGKRIWLLQYDGAGHSIGNTENDDVAQTDWTIRQKQFFDYYLKDAQAPKWMVEGVPARLKGIDNGLELMPKGVKVPESKILTKEVSEGWRSDLSQGK